MDGASFAPYLKHQAFLHPSMTPQDTVKLCFQAAFGAEHILTDAAQARRVLLIELAGTPPRPIAVFEPISAVYTRCNLAAWKYWQLPPEWLCQVFLHSTAEKREAAKPLFLAYLRIVTACAGQGLLPFSGLAWQQYLDRYLAGGIRPLHHSASYRLREAPAYRIIKSEDLKLLPALGSPGP